MSLLDAFMFRIITGQAFRSHIIAPVCTLHIPSMELLFISWILPVILCLCLLSTAMAAAVSGGAHADAGAGPVSGLPSALAGVLNGSAEDTIPLKSILEAVQNNQAVDIMEIIAGSKLNSETRHQYFASILEQSLLVPHGHVPISVANPCRAGFDFHLLAASFFQHISVLLMYRLWVSLALAL